MGIAADLALALDPARLLAAVGYTPDPWQADVLRQPAPRTLLNIHRQGGKSDTTAALGIHDALYSPHSLVLLLSPSLRQSGELFRKVMRLYDAVGRPIPTEEATALHLTLANGSRVVALPGKEATIRGFSGVTRLIVDEAARVPDELYYAVRPMLAVSGGGLIAMSTPFGKRGWWHREWSEGGEGWTRIEVRADQCPRIGPAFLAEERRALGPWWYAQEYECRFMETTDQVFRYEDIRRALTEDVAPLFAGGLAHPAQQGDVAPAAAVGAPVVAVSG